MVLLRRCKLNQEAEIQWKDWLEGRAGTVELHFYKGKEGISKVTSKVRW